MKSEGGGSCGGEGVEVFVDIATVLVQSGSNINARIQTAN